MEPTLMTLVARQREAEVRRSIERRRIATVARTSKDALARSTPRRRGVTESLHALRLNLASAMGYRVHRAAAMPNRSTEKELACCS
ncbi:MAG: hypothetical protein ACRDO2_01750 [Nocardioidaceae bacterium]